MRFEDGGGFQPIPVGTFSHGSRLVGAALALLSAGCTPLTVSFTLFAKDKKLVGPAYKDVAAKYKDDKAAVDKLAVKIVKGGSGVWGAVPMPANPQVNAEEAKTLATWVLTIK